MEKLNQSKVILTSVEIQKSDPERVNLYLNGKFFTGLSVVRFQQLNFSKGQHLSPAELSELESAIQSDKIWYFLLASLNKTRQTESRIRQKLLSKGFDKETIETCIQSAREKDFLNDQKYAEVFVSDCRLLKKWGGIRIKNELRKRGISPEIISKVVSDDSPDEKEVTSLQILVKRKYSPLTDVKNQQKAIRFLQYRGYGWEVIKKVINIPSTEVESDAD